MSNQQTIEDLRAARALIEKGWLRHHYAADHSLVPTDVEDDDAVCFCPLGAIRRVVWEKTELPGEGRPRIKRAVLAAQAELRAPYKTIPQFNDAPNRTQAEVLKLFDDAIASLVGETAEG